MNAKPRIGVSACLLGHPVRFNGDHKRSEWISETLAKHAALIGFCPETFMGLPTPRPALRFVETDLGIRLLESNSKFDRTDSAKESNLVLAEQAENLDGFILKKDSPSCGLERVKVYGRGGMPIRSGTGLFARSLKQRYPALPIIEEGRLCDSFQRDNFVLRVFAYHEARILLARGDRLLASEVQSFHRKYKLILLEHAPAYYVTLGKVVGNAEKKTAPEILHTYLPQFMTALEALPTVGTRVNVLQHALGYLRKLASSKERSQILESISDFQRGDLPFIAPLALLFHEIRKFGIHYLEEQKFFAPFPRELGGQVRL